MTDRVGEMTVCSIPFIRHPIHSPMTVIEHNPPQERLLDFINDGIRQLREAGKKGPDLMAMLDLVALARLLLGEVGEVLLEVAELLELVDQLLGAGVEVHLLDEPMLSRVVYAGSLTSDSFDFCGKDINNNLPNLKALK